MICCSVTLLTASSYSISTGSAGGATERKEVRIETSERDKEGRHKRGKGWEEERALKVMENKIKKGHNKYNLFLPSVYGYCQFLLFYRSSSVR